MIEANDIMPLAYFAKEPFTGSYKGMRYRIDSIKEEKKSIGLIAWVWPQPFSFECTPDEEKLSETFGFDEEGREKVLEWLNDSYTKGEELYREAALKNGLS